MTRAAKRVREAPVISVLEARSNFGALMERVGAEQRSVVIQKRGTPQAVLLSLSDYMKLATPEPDILRIIGEKSVKNGTDKLTSRQIDDVIRKARAERKKR